MKGGLVPAVVAGSRQWSTVAGGRQWMVDGGRRGRSSGWSEVGVARARGRRRLTVARGRWCLVMVGSRRWLEVDVDQKLAVVIGGGDGGGGGGTVVDKIGNIVVYFWLLSQISHLLAFQLSIVFFPFD